MDQKEQAVMAVLRSTGVDELEAAMLARDALKWEHGRVKRAMKCLAAGAEKGAGDFGAGVRAVY